MLLNCGVGEDSWESLGLQGDPIRQSLRKSSLNIHWRTDTDAKGSFMTDQHGLYDKLKSSWIISKRETVIFTRPLFFYNYQS